VGPLHLQGRQDELTLPLRLCSRFTYEDNGANGMPSLSTKTICIQGACSAIE
jgi:hypothetical protein